MVKTPSIIFYSIFSGFCQGCRYGENIGELTLLMVKEKYCGRGIGGALLHKTMQHLGDCNVHVDSVIGVEGLYAKYGFRFKSHQLTKFKGLSKEQPNKLTKTPPGVQILPLDAVKWDKVLQYDLTLHPFVRSEDLKKHFTRENKKTFVAIDGKGLVIGIICYHPGCSRISPFYADTPDVAELLLRQILSLYADFKIEASVLHSNKEAVKLMSHYLTGEHVPYTTRMYTKQAVNFPNECIYATKWFKGYF